MNTKNKSFSQTKKKLRTEVSNTLRQAGFIVNNVHVVVDDSCEPSIGYHVFIKGKNTPERRIKAEKALWNYAYKIAFTG